MKSISMEAFSLDCEKVFLVIEIISAIFGIYQPQLQIYQRFLQYIDLPTKFDNDSSIKTPPFLYTSTKRIASFDYIDTNFS